VITLSVSMMVLLDRAEIAAARAAGVYDETVSEGSGESGRNSDGRCRQHAMGLRKYP
jgi:hypothetical protein